MQPKPRHSKLDWLESAILVSPFAFLALEWKRFPDRVPIHSNIHGAIDGWAPKGFGLLIFPVSAVLIYALVRALPHLDPKIRRSPREYERTGEVVRIIGFSLLVLLVGIFAVQAAAALGFPVPMKRCIPDAFLAALMVIGNFLPGLRPNYFAGFRTPWTLENPETWRATHRIGGRILVYGSLFLLVSQWLVADFVWCLFLVIYIFGIPLWMVVYSWNHDRTHKQAH